LHCYLHSWVFCVCSLTINTVRENIHNNLCFLLIPSGCKTRISLIQNLYRFSCWKSLHRESCSMIKIFIPENSKQYFCTVIYILECSVCGLQYVGESSSPSTNAWMDTGVTLQKKTFLFILLKSSRLIRQSEVLAHRKKCFFL
jgi:hypothetical protein